MLEQIAEVEMYRAVSARMREEKEQREAEREENRARWEENMRRERERQESMSDQQREEERKRLEESLGADRRRALDNQAARAEQQCVEAEAIKQRLAEEFDFSVSDRASIELYYAHRCRLSEGMNCRGKRAQEICQVLHKDPRPVSDEWMEKMKQVVGLYNEFDRLRHTSWWIRR